MKKRREEGFSLLEVAIAIALISILTIMVAGWQVYEYKEKKTKEIATTLLAIDVAMYQVDALIKNVNANYNIPINPNWSNKTSTTWDSYVCPIRNTKSWRYRSEYAGVEDILVDNYLDPRVDVKKLTMDGYRFEFIRDTSNKTIKYIKVYGLDRYMNDLLQLLLPDSWDGNKLRYKLNKGNGYRYRPLYYTCQ